ncbi:MULTISPECIES: conjugal transfer protein TrbL [Micrococcales]|uniref:Conjugal transfer protein TrbL n=3 Tax=Micrococcales TaxID=85006 RepID=A0A444B5C9_9MICO|nr:MULTISPECIES: conjugal transfer protein TrbL [Micrococcales]MBX3079094.1 conjugal transfer protein TrbL [Cryobacterium sp.]MCL6423334.1 type IV secretion system protein [Brachybacterium equifaecis]NHC30737.1 type IV secretion system protein [Dermacoccus nishinomiyaensis]RWU83605.1 conjugal transfer protein TrbL [Janibacter hoylei PVAS-1]
MGVCDVPVISSVCDVAGEAAATVVAAPFDWLAQAMGGAAGWLIEAMWAVFDTTTLVDVQTDGFTNVYNLIFGIGVFLVLIFFCLQLITGLIKRDPTALSRAALGAAKSVLGAFVVVTLTALALEIVDQLCIGIIQASGETTETMGDKIILLAAGLTGINIAAPGVGAIVTIFLAGLMIAAVFIVWFSLLIRKALLLVGVVLAPIAFAGASWDATKGWIGKWAAFVIALIVSKLVLVVIFLLAITQIATPIEADITAVTEPITGIVLMGIAAFAPYMAYRFVSFIGFDLYQQMGTEQEAKNALNRPLPLPSKTPGGGEPKKVLDDPQGGDPGGGKVSGGGPGGSPSPRTPAPAAASGTGSAGTAGAGTSAGSGAAAGAGGGAAAAGPAAAVVVGAQVVKGAAESGPKAGKAVAGQAETAASGAEGQAGSGQTAPSKTPPPPSAPQPRTPAPSQPAPPQTGKE